MVTLIPKFPFSANNWAMDVSKTRQSEFSMADDTPSWIERGVASHVSRRLWPLNSNLKQMVKTFLESPCHHTCKEVTSLTCRQNCRPVFSCQSAERSQKTVANRHTSLAFLAPTWNGGQSKIASSPNQLHREGRYPLLKIQYLRLPMKNICHSIAQCWGQGEITRQTLKSRNWSMLIE